VSTRLLFGIAVAIAWAAPALAADRSQPRAVTVVATEYEFSPATLTFRRGALYRLHLENHGKEQHEFTAPEFFKAVRLRNPEALNADRTEAEIPPGAAKDLFFVPQQPGHYPLRCSDHDWAGMTGAITVK
jgi:uncharacterized cupredoxin-like copper-binding protein